MNNIKLREFAQQNQLQFDDEKGMAYGNYNGYSVGIMKDANKNYSVFLSITNNRAPLSVDEFKQFAKSEKEIFTAYTINGKSGVFTIRGGMSESKTLQKLQVALNKITSYLGSLGYRNVCYGCSQQVQTSMYYVNAALVDFCDNCFDKVNQSISREEQNFKNKSENVPFGIAGAFLGSLLGVAAIVILGQLGYIAAISGFIMALFTLKGYEKFAGKLSKVGVIASVIILFVMTIFGNRLDWAISISRELGNSLFEIFVAMPDIIKTFDLQSNYYLNLGLLLFIALIGCYAPVKNAFLNPSNKANISKLNSGVAY